MSNKFSVKRRSLQDSLYHLIHKGVFITISLFKQFKSMFLTSVRIFIGVHQESVWNTLLAMKLYLMMVKSEVVAEAQWREIMEYMEFKINY